MGITVLSPHDGQPVKVRDKDVGRAVKDREGRIFYVLEKSDGTGYYGAMTRAGGEREEQRALKLEARTEEVDEHKHAVTGAGRPEAAVFDATGKGRSGGVGRALFLAIVVGALIVFGWIGYSMWAGGDLPWIPLDRPQELPEAVDDDTDLEPGPEDGPQADPNDGASNTFKPTPVPGVRLPYPERGLISAIISGDGAPTVAARADNTSVRLSLMPALAA